MNRYLPFLLLTLLSLLSARALSAQCQENAPASPLTRDIPNREICWLMVADQPVLSLFRRANRGEAKGGVLILPGLNKNPASPGLIDTLRHTLPENRWHTLVVDMPQQLGEQAAAQAQQRIDAGVSHFNSEGIYNIVLIGDGTGANHAMTYISKLPPPAPNSYQQIRGLAMINPLEQLAGYPDPLSELVRELSMPALDIYIHHDYRQQQQAKLRQDASRQLPKGLYVQVKLPLTVPVAHDQEERLSKRVRGWLDRNTSGLAVKLGKQ